jgi:membrane protein implicated in regulation of membrane protease activity
MMDFSPNAWQLWVVTGLILVALEVKLSGYVMLWFGVGAFASALLASLGLSFNIQLLTFNVLSVALLLSSRTLFRRFFMRDASSVRHGVEAMLGSEAVVVEKVPADGFGTVRINGELWTARSLEGSIDQGEIVRVENLEGLKLAVRRRRPAMVIAKAEEEIR